MIPGMISGNVIFKNVRSGGEPRSDGGVLERPVEAPDAGLDGQRDEREREQRSGR